LKWLVAQQQWVDRLTQGKTFCRISKFADLIEVGFFMSFFN
jgi:hypothetical protein